MKPTILAILSAVALCGCDPWARPVQRDEFFDLKVKMQNELHDINVRLNAPGSSEKNRNSKADFTIPDQSTGRLVARGEIKEIQIVEVPKGFTLITLPDGRPALVPDDK